MFRGLRDAPGRPISCVVCASAAHVVHPAPQTAPAPCQRPIITLLHLQASSALQRLTYQRGDSLRLPPSSPSPRASSSCLQHRWGPADPTILRSSASRGGGPSCKVHLLLHTVPGALNTDLGGEWRGWDWRNAAAMQATARRLARPYRAPRAAASPHTIPGPLRAVIFTMNDLAATPPEFRTHWHCAYATRKDEVSITSARCRRAQNAWSSRVSEHPLILTAIRPAPHPCPRPPQDVSIVATSKAFSSGVALYAIADGHNGQAAARHVQGALPAELERQLGAGPGASGPASVLKGLARAFVAVDDAVCRRHVQSGARTRAHRVLRLGDAGGLCRAAAGLHTALETACTQLPTRKLHPPHPLPRTCPQAAR